MTVKEIYVALVIEGGLDPTYVMDKMLMYELEPLISNIHKRNKESWEQARIIAYLIAQVNSTKLLNPLDILKFEWDKETTPINTSISNEDVIRLRNKAKQHINLK